MAAPSCSSLPLPRLDWLRSRRLRLVPVSDSIMLKRSLFVWNGCLPIYLFSVRLAKTRLHMCISMECVKVAVNHIDALQSEVACVMSMNSCVG